MAKARSEIDDEARTFAPQHAVGADVRHVRRTASQHREQSTGCGDRNQGQLGHGCKCKAIVTDTLNARDASRDFAFNQPPRKLVGATTPRRQQCSCCGSSRRRPPRRRPSRTPQGSRRGMRAPTESSNAAAGHASRQPPKTHDKDQISSVSITCGVSTSTPGRPATSSSAVWARIGKVL